MPITAAVCVIGLAASEMARAMPKSITFTAPERVIMTLAGLTSRWTIMLRWLKSRAAHTSATTSMARFGVIGPWERTMSRSVSPSTNSMTMYGSGPDSVSASPVSYTATIAGWFNAAAFWASRRNRR